MRTRAFLPLIAHGAVCIVLGCVFLWYGASEAVRVGNLGPVTAFHTTDKYMKVVVGDPAGSEHLLQAINALPEDEAVAVIFREQNDADTLLAYLVTYFAWPRPVISVPIDHVYVNGQRPTPLPDQWSARFFCGVTPPANLEPRIQIGDGLTIVPRADAKGGMP